MEKPIISLIASAIRVHLWPELYTMLCNKNNVKFEIIFVGPLDVEYWQELCATFPAYSSMENFHFIHSDAKPVQCVEIACRNAIGEFVMLIADDLLFYPETLNAMYDYAMRIWDEKTIVSIRFSDKTEGPPMDNLSSINIAFLNPPVIGICALVRKKFWTELGGLDRRFDKVYADYDLQLRMYEAGGHPFIVPYEYTTVRERPHDYARLIDGYPVIMPDKILLDYLWANFDGSYGRNRLDSVQSFTDDEIPIVR